MSLYMVIEIKVNNPSMYKKYINEVSDIIEKYGGKYVVRSEDITTLSGDWSPERIIIIKFKDEKQIKKCFSSEEYQEIAPLRENSTESKAIIVKEI